jgi:hypothetical protein
MTTRVFFFSILMAIGFLNGGNTVLAQNEPQFTQYMFNRLLLNPAYAGSNKGLELAGVARIQYVGLANTVSTTQGLSVSSSVAALHGGVGLTLVNDMIGLQRSTGLQFLMPIKKDSPSFR